MSKMSNLDLKLREIRTKVATQAAMADRATQLIQNDQPGFSLVKSINLELTEIVQDIDDAIA